MISPTSRPEVGLLFPFFGGSGGEGGGGCFDGFCRGPARRIMIGPRNGVCVFVC